MSPSAVTQRGEPFSVLMPLWGKDDPVWVERAIRSATIDQQLQPDHLILTVDGPLPPALEQITERVEAGEFGPARVLRHPTHRGIAAALQDGLLAAPTELVARADADDLCRPERFARQIPVMASGDLDVLGSAMQEFSDRISVGTGPWRSRPLTQERIEAYATQHCPFHHPTVVLRRSAVLAAGGYRDLALLEDYWLWQRMLLAGARVANVPEALVDYRVDEQLFRRRGGMRLLLSDLWLQRQMLRDRMIGPGRFAVNVLQRALYRLAPSPLRRLVYRLGVERWLRRRSG